MAFKKIETPLEWCFVIEPQVFWDERGFFMETYSKKEFEKIGICDEFVQDNHSKSKAGVLRGFHFQTKNPQSKLVRVISWSVYDFAIDLRKNSPTFCNWFAIKLSSENKKQFYLPKWFWHAFITLEDNTEFIYKCDEFYEPEFDSWIYYQSIWSGFDIKDYYNKELFLSEKDSKLLTLENFKKINTF